MKSKFLASATAAFLIIAGSVSLGANAASATYDEVCVPSEAWTEVVPDIEHPAVGEPKIVVENPDYKPATEGTAAVWANFSPNDQHATFVGPAVYPVDERGTWHDHGQLPPGQAGPDGVYANGNPDKGGNWFYRQAAVPGTPAEGDPTIEIDNPDYEPAYTEIVADIEHPAVTCEEEPPVVVNECVEGVSTHSTNLNNLWGNVDTRSAGHYEYVEGGLHVWTDDNSSQAKVSLGQAISFPLHDTGVLDIQWTGTTPPPGLNLFVNFGADGNGTLVYESVYGQDLWLTNGSSAAVKANAPVNGGGNGSQWHGTINQWLEEYPEATVTGIAFSLGSGVLGDGVISSITVGCGTHTFDYEQEITPVAAQFNVTPVAPTCLTAGSFGETLFPIDREGYVLSVDRPFDGPGVYTITATAKPGFSIQGALSVDVTILGPTGFQSEDNEAPCYVEVPPESTTSSDWEYTVTCDNEVGDEVPATRETTTETSSLNTVTGEIEVAGSTSTEEGTHVVTSEDLAALECEDEEAPPMGGDLGILAMTGGSAIQPFLWLAGGLISAGVLALVVWLALRRRVNN